MLFNLDKESKKNILENYRREALISTLRKIEQRKKEKEEDKFNLEQKEQRQNEIIELINKEKLAKKEKLKKEYNLMLQRTKGFLTKKNQLILKNWGQKKDPFVLPVLNSEKTGINKDKENKILLNEISNDKFEKLTPNQKQKEILKQIDHMDGYLTDKQNEKEMKQFFKIRKENRYNFYKDLLFSQYQEAINKDFNLYGTNDEIIIKQKKRKNLTSNPYILKRNYDFGSSSLVHNPIVNPENNYNYNKYIDYQSYILNPNTNRSNSLYKFNNMENLKLSSDNIYDTRSINNYENNRNNKNDWNNNISENHTIDLSYKKDFNKNDKIPLRITKYKFNIMNKDNNNGKNSLFKRNFSQSDIYPNC